MNLLLVYPLRLDPGGRLVQFRQAFLPPLSLAILTALPPAPDAVRVVSDLVGEIDIPADVDLVGFSIITSPAERVPGGDFPEPAQDCSQPGHPVVSVSAGDPGRGPHFFCGFGRDLAREQSGQSKSAGLLTEIPGRFRTWV